MLEKITAWRKALSKEMGEACRETLRESVAGDATRWIGE
jgi:hypothetical protein